jgi:hypothetical protein
MDDLFSYTPPPPPPPEAHARHSDPETSHEAARLISRVLREKQRIVLLFAGQNPDGFTDRALEQATGNSGATYRTRRAELTDMGYIRDSGEKETIGRTRHIVWQITLAGLNALRESA